MLNPEGHRSRRSTVSTHVSTLTSKVGGFISSHSPSPSSPRPSSPGDSDENENSHGHSRKEKKKKSDGVMIFPVVEGDFDSANGLLGSESLAAALDIDEDLLNEDGTPTTIHSRNRNRASRIRANSGAAATAATATAAATAAAVVPNDEEAPAPLYVPFRTSFATLSLHASDRIRLLQFPDDIIQAVHDTIVASWAPGIQEENPYATSYEFKCKGNPWSGQGTSAIPARVLLRDVLARLYAEGWILTAATDVSRKALDKDTMIFRRQQVAPPPSDWFAVSFNQNDRMRFIGAPPGLVGAVHCLLQDMGLLQEENWKDHASNAFEFRMCGHPWSAMGEETMTARLLILRMIETFELHGWSLYTSVDQHDSSGGQDTDTWYCNKSQSWAEGDAIIHR